MPKNDKSLKRKAGKGVAVILCGIAARIFPYVLISATMIAAEIGLQAAAVRINVTPEECWKKVTNNPTELTEGCAPDDVKDSNHVRFVVFGNGEKKAVVGSWNFLLIPPDGGLNGGLPDDIGAVVAEAVGTTEDLVFQVATHNHSAPIEGPDGKDFISGKYLQRVVDSLQSAVARMKPVRIGFSGARGDSIFGANRRPDWDPDWNLPFDNFVSLLRIDDDATGVPMACMYGYPAHQTGFEFLNMGDSPEMEWAEITKDREGWSMDYTEELFAGINPEFVALFLQGGAGDCMYPYPENYAGMLSQARQIADSIYRWVSDIEIKQATPVLEGVFRAEPIGISGLKIGTMAFLGVHGEPFNEILANIRAHSPFQETFVCGFTNGYVDKKYKFMLGYHPSYDAKEDGLPGDIYSKPESIEYAIVDSAISVLTALKGAGYQRNRLEPVSAFASSHANGHGPELVIDGEQSRPAWYADNEAFPKWVMLDMGSQVEIARVVVNFGGFTISETGRAYEIQISQDDNFADYLTIGSESENKTSIMGYATDSITGRYVRLYCTTAGADTGITSPSVYEIDVYGASELNSRVNRPVVFSNGGKTGQVEAFRKVYDIRGRYLYTKHSAASVSRHDSRGNRVFGTAGVRIHRDDRNKAGISLRLESK